MRYRGKTLLTAGTVAMLCWGTAACAGESERGEERSQGAELAESSAEHAAEDSGVEAATVEPTGTPERSEADETRERGEHDERAAAREEGEHREGRETEEHEGGEHDEGGEGEESGVYVARGVTWDATRRGARLVLAFDAESVSFVGTVENTTGRTLCAVRVEVHLATGSELGPTDRSDLPPGQSIEVRLPTGGASFESWTAHPEVSRCSS